MIDAANLTTCGE